SSAHPSRRSASRPTTSAQSSDSPPSPCTNSAGSRPRLSTSSSGDFASWRPAAALPELSTGGTGGCGACRTKISPHRVATSEPGQSMRSAYPPERDDRPQHLAAMHLSERRLPGVERDRLRHEGVEIEPALQVAIDEHREIPRGQAIAIPRRLQRSPATEHVEQRQVEPNV